MLGDGQVRDEGVDLGLRHVGRMAEPVEADVPPHPEAVGLLGAAAVVARPQGALQLVDELGHRPSLAGRRPSSTGDRERQRAGRGGGRRVDAITVCRCSGGLSPRSRRDPLHREGHAVVDADHQVHRGPAVLIRPDFDVVAGVQLVDGLSPSARERTRRSWSSSGETLLRAICAHPSAGFTFEGDRPAAVSRWNPSAPLAVIRYLPAIGAVIWWAGWRSKTPPTLKSGIASYDRTVLRAAARDRDGGVALHASAGGSVGPRCRRWLAPRRPRAGPASGCTGERVLDLGRGQRPVLPWPWSRPRS